MSHPLRENLETIEINGSESIRCVKCQFHYCRADQVWRDFCKVRFMAAGERRQPHGHFERCPSDAAILLPVLRRAGRYRFC